MLKEFIDSHLPEDLSLRSLGQYSLLNEFNLKSGFRKLYGTNIFGNTTQQTLITEKDIVITFRFKVNLTRNLFFSDGVFIVQHLYKARSNGNSFGHINEKQKIL